MNNQTLDNQLQELKPGDSLEVIDTETGNVQVFTRLDDHKKTVTGLCIHTYVYDNEQSEVPHYVCTKCGLGKFGIIPGSQTVVE